MHLSCGAARAIRLENIAVLRVGNDLTEYATTSVVRANK